MPKVQYTQVDYDVNADIEDIAVYDHEVRTTVDLSDLEGDVLNAIKFDSSSDLLTWAVREKDMSADDIYQTLLDHNMVSTHLRTNQKELKEYTTDELFQEIMGRNIGQVI